MANREQLNFSVTGETLKTFESLKKTFNVTTSAAVLRRALALAKVCQAQRREDNTVQIGEVVVLLDG